MTCEPDPVATPGEVLRQAWADWTDKEVQAGYTYTYIWMTNQLGHFTLGFFPILLLSWPLAGCIAPGDDAGHPRWSWWLLALPLAWAAFWVAKEVWDVRRAEAQTAGRQFPLDSGDLWKDAGTAVFFIWCGIIVATLGLRFYDVPFWAFLVLLAIALIPSYYWLERKLCFQRAELPFLARLADFTGQFDRTPPRLDPEAILAFSEAAKSGTVGGCHHLLLFGAMGTGRTTLAVAMGTEHAFEVRKARYLTWTKFLELASDTRPGQHDAPAWPWRAVDILILDDVIDHTSATAGELREEKRREIAALPSAARRALSEMRVVWVFGEVRDDQPSPPDWIHMLATSFGIATTEFGWAELKGGFAPVRVPVASLSGH